MKIKILFLFFSFLVIQISMSAPIKADKTLSFCTFPIPLMVENEEKGVFIDLAKRIAKRAHIDIHINVLPPKRAINNFLKGDADALFPALDVNFPTGIKFAKTQELIYIKEDFVFTKKGNPMLITIQDLEEKKIGITLGYPYVFELTHNNLIKLETAITDEQNAIKLIKGRLDAFVVEEKSGLKAFKKTNLYKEMQYNPRIPLSRQDVYFAFQYTDDGNKFAELFSNALKEMKKDGTFGKIMSKVNPE